MYTEQSIMAMQRDTFVSITGVDFEIFAQIFQVCGVATPIQDRFVLFGSGLRLGSRNDFVTERFL